MAVRALCLILDAMVLAGGDYPASPEAVAVVGAVHQLQGELARGRSGASLSLLVIEDDSSAGAIAVLRDIAGRDLPAVRVEPGEPVGRDLCPPGSEEAILIAGDDGRPAGPGVTRWRIGDAHYGLADVRDAPRRLREALGQPVPRPMAPAMITGGLVALPPGTPDLTLLRALYEDPAASFFRLNRRPFVYTENSDLEDSLVERQGAERLSFAVNTGRLRLVTGEAPADSEVLWRDGQTALILLAGDAPDAGLAWDELRFRKLR